MPSKSKVNDSKELSTKSWRQALALCSSGDSDIPNARELLLKAAKELISDGEHTFNPETYTVAERKIATEVFTEIAQGGSYLVPPHGQMLWSGQKKGIVRSKSHEEFHKSFTLLCSGRYCYGVIRYKEPLNVSLDEFMHLKSKHRISEAERDAWWPSLSKLYFFEVRDCFRFEKPVRIKMPKEIREFVENADKNFSSLEVDEDDNMLDAFVLPTILDATKEIDEISVDSHEAIAYSVAGNLGNEIVYTRHLRDISNTELLVRHADIHDLAEASLHQHEKILEVVLNSHSRIVCEMQSRGIEHFVGTMLDNKLSVNGFVPSLRIKALGTRAGVNESSAKHEKCTGVLLDLHGKKILLDCGEKEFLDEKPDIVLLSHFHNDNFAWHDANIKELPVVKSNDVVLDDDTNDLMRTPIRAWGSTIHRDTMIYEHPECSVYCEPFAGSASTLFVRKPVKIEVLNDLNEDTAFQLQFIKGLTPKQFLYLKKQNWKPSMDTWKHLREVLKKGKYKNDAHRFYVLKYMSRYSFHWTGSKPGGAHVKNESDKGFNIAQLEKAHERLKNVKIFNKDYATIIKEYDGNGTFMLLDPPFRDHAKGQYANEGLDWDEYYRLLGSMKGKFIALNSNSSADKASLNKLGIKFSVRDFPGSGAHVGSGVAKRRKYIFSANFPLKTRKGKSSKMSLDNVSIYEPDQEDAPDTLFVASPFSKCDVSKKAKAQGFDIEFAEDYEFDAFKFQSFPVKHSVARPAVAWKIKAGEKTILFVPNVLEIDKQILDGVDIYIGDGTTYSNDIQRRTGKQLTGHMSIDKQIAMCKEAGIESVYFVHVGKEIVEKPELDDSVEDQISETGAVVLEDGQVKDVMVKIAEPKKTFEFPPEEFSDDANSLNVKILAIGKIKDVPGVICATCAVQESKRFVYVGKVFSSKFRLVSGQIISVRVQDMASHVDPDTGRKWFNWTNPLVTGICEDKTVPDTIDVVEELACTTHGEVWEEEMPRIAKETLGILEFEDFTRDEVIQCAIETSNELGLGIDDLVEVENEPPMPREWEDTIRKWFGLTRNKLAKTKAENLPDNFFVLQSHYRGKTSHIDIRVKIDGTYEGRTLLSQKPVVITEPVTTIDEAEMWSKKYHGPNASKYTKFYPKMPPHQGVIAQSKEKGSLEWLTYVKEVIPAGSAGATKKFPGIIWGEDWGIAFKTVDKPSFSEWWIFGKWFNGARLVDRVLPTRGTKKTGKSETYRRAHVTDKKSPPYIFSPSFFKNTEWVPEDSALPPNWEAAVPEKLKWWGKKLPRRERIALIKATFNYFIEEKYLKGKKKLLDESNFGVILSVDRRKYVMHRVWWRGCDHARNIPISTWYLRIEGGKNKGLITYKFESNPARKSEKGFVALKSMSKIKPPRSKDPEDWFQFEGDLPLNHPENPTKKFIAHVVKEDSGYLSMVADSPDFMSGNFSGEELGLNGYCIFIQESSKHWKLIPVTN